MPDLTDELAAAHRRTAALAADSMLNVDRRGWTDEQWIADARRLMDHIDGSAACLLNGHVGAMLRALDRQDDLLAAARAEGEQRVRSDMRRGIRFAIYEAGLWCGDCDPADKGDGCCVLPPRIRAALATPPTTGGES